MAERTTGELVEVWRAWGDAETHMIRGLLEAHGIPSAIRGESTRLTHGLTMDGLAEVRILVRAEDAEEAKRLIRSRNEVKTCPSCEGLTLRSDQSCRWCGTPIGLR